MNSGLSLLSQGQIKGAKRRIVMASLYLGTGPLEQELVGLSRGGDRPGLGLPKALEIDTN